LKIFIVAGEHSGDSHAAELIHALKNARPDADYYSAGGKELAKCTTQVVDLTQIAVTGFFEVISFLPKILQIMKALVKDIEDINPDIVIFTDFPDFNFNLAKRIKKPHRKLVYFISPQLWAWRKGRINTVKKLFDKMLVIFPFEATFYRKQKVKATFVGNPIVNTIRQRQISSKPLEKSKKPRILLLPGSRIKEINMNLTAMVDAKFLIEKKIDADFAILKHPELDMALFDYATQKGVDIIENDSFDEFTRTDLAIACSGTVTLELALSGVPSVVMYKMASSTYFIAKALIKVSGISMPNIILGHHVFPELIQDAANPLAISENVIAIMSDEKRYNDIKKELKRLHSLISPFDPKLAASEILAL